MILMPHDVVWGSRKAAIENEVRSLQLELWETRRKSRIVASESPIDILQPGVALNAMGYNVETVHSLGEMGWPGRRARVAGSIDRDRKIVRIASEQFTNPEQLFTAAHELAHAKIHPNGKGVHRDRPMDTAGWYKDPEEREADFFAVCFLMPEKQVRLWFGALFLTERFVLTDATAFALGAKSRDALMRRGGSLRNLTFLLAQMNAFNGKPIRSLVELFHVSPTAMAIRLEELGLVEDPNGQKYAY